LQSAHTFISSNITILFISLLIICFILLTLTLINLITISKLKKRITLFFGTDKNKHSIEAMLIEYLAKVNIIDDKYSNLQQYVERLDKELYLCIQKVGIIRYNPFDNSGGDLSFALALLDRNNKGVVLNTLHNREQTYSYAKSVSGLDSSHPLSAEEKEAIQMAMNQK
jgi:hypothetical protein